MKKQFEKIKTFPAYGIVPALLAVAVLLTSYFLTRLLESALPIRYVNILTPLDEMIPLVPGWIIPYVLCFPIWAISLLLICWDERERSYRSICSILLGFLLSAVIFLALPTTLDRPTIDSDAPGLCNAILRFIYTVDQPTHLFPSLHCFNSYMCWRCIHGRQDIFKGYRVFLFLFLPVVFASVLLTRQHLILDIPGGVLLGEACYQIGQHTRLWKLLDRLWLKIAAHRK